MPKIKIYPVVPGTRITDVVDLDQGQLQTVHVPHELGDHIWSLLSRHGSMEMVETEIAAFALDEPIMLAKGTKNGLPFIYRMSEEQRQANRAFMNVGSA